MSVATNWSLAMTEDERTIRAVIDTWMTATKSGDVATVLSLMTDDVVFMVPGAEPFGRERFAATAGDLQGTQIEGRSDIVELKVLGDWAFARTHLRVTMTAPGQPPMRRAGHTLTLFRKEPDGKWRLARDANLLTQQKAGES
jgi:uncharacterized protein (TIGR02246 family)